MNDKDVFSSGAAVIGSFLSYLFGCMDNSIIILSIFIGLDYLTGVWAAIINKTLSSDIGRKGVFKKATIFIVLVVAVLLDRLLNKDVWVFRTLVCYFYIANEGISLLENAVKIGVPIPQKIIDVLEQIKSKEEKEPGA